MVSQVKGPEDAWGLVDVPRAHGEAQHTTCLYNLGVPFLFRPPGKILEA